MSPLSFLFLWVWKYPKRDAYCLYNNRVFPIFSSLPLCVGTERSKASSSRRPKIMAAPARPLWPSTTSSPLPRRTTPTIAWARPPWERTTGRVPRRPPCSWRPRRPWELPPAPAGPAPVEWRLRGAATPTLQPPGPSPASPVGLKGE